MDIIEVVTARLSKAEQKMIEKEVKSITYTQCSPRTIFCVVITHNDHETYGISACRDLNTFNEDLGKLYALRHALGRLYRTSQYSVDTP